MIRFLCREVDESPVQVDCPAHKKFITFDDAQSLEMWLREDLPVNRRAPWVHRELVGIELLTEMPAR